MTLDRSHLVLAAAVGFAVLAGVEVFRGREPGAIESAPRLAAETPAAPGPVPAAPPASAERALPMLRVEGRITNSLGGPIPDARVALRGDSGSAQRSDASGAYALDVERGEGGSPALRFSAAGYQDRLVPLESADDGDGRLWLDVRLEPAPGAVVSGTLESERGTPIPGETIHLVSRALDTSYGTVSDAQGRFLIPGVEAGAGYYLSVSPRRNYRDYQTPLAVEPEGVSLEISLRELSTTRLTGRLEDPEGRPIANLDFFLVSGQARSQRLPVRTDPDGRFSLEGVPTGHLSLLAAAPESLVIGGLLLPPGADGYVTIRADWGNAALYGRVVGEDGRPLPGAEVELSWSYADEGAARRSNRTAVTDAGGVFELRRLGTGVRRLEVRAPGYRQVEVDYEVTSESPGVEVELVPVRGTG